MPCLSAASEKEFQRLRGYLAFTPELMTSFVRDHVCLQTSLQYVRKELKRFVNLRKELRDSEII